MKQKVVDLTHPLSETTPTWDGTCGFELSISTDYADSAPPDIFRIQRIHCAAGIGTHMDAPSHVIPGGKTIDAIGLEELITNCVVIDVSSEADESYVAMPSAVAQFEKETGPIPRGSFVIFYTGWDKHWSNPSAYINNHKSPSIHVSTAEILLERGIAGLGIDTLSADTGANGFPVHHAILGAGKYLVENIANAKELPGVGAKILVMPLKIKGGTEAPVRLVALLSGSNVF